MEGIGAEALSRRACYTPEHFVEAYNAATKKETIQSKMLVTFMVLNLSNKLKLYNISK